MTLCQYGRSLNVGLLLVVRVITHGSQLLLSTHGDVTTAITGLEALVKTAGCSSGISTSGCCIVQKRYVSILVSSATTKVSFYLLTLQVIRPTERKHFFSRCFTSKSYREPGNVTASLGFQSNFS